MKRSSNYFMHFFLVLLALMKLSVIKMQVLLLELIHRH